MVPALRRQFSSLLVLLALLGTTVNAQGTNATCGPSFDWMSNSRGQNPCLITAYLNTPCLSNPADAYVYSLPTGFHYRPPLAVTATACQCNTVFYSVIQACAVCQGDPIVPWSTWNANCTSAIYQSVYPEPIPSGTAVPAWAYIDVSKSDNFNATAAQLNEQENHPESTASGPSATGAVPSATNVPSSSGKKSNTGAIVGGVVGGIGGAAILAAIAFFFWRRHQRNVSARSAAAATKLDPGYDASGTTYGSEKAGVPTVYSPIPVTTPSPPPTSGYVPGRIYDPNDPSTFPTAGAAPSLHTAQTTTVYSPSPAPVQLYGSNQAQYQQQHAIPSSGHYTGAPEV